MSVVGVREAKTHLSRLIRRVEAGEEVVIARAGQPVVRLVAVAKKVPKVPGRLKGEFKIGDDFDDPLPEDVFSSESSRSRSTPKH